MLELRWAKSKMENEEGLNYLWIRWDAEDTARDRSCELRIDLPDGLFRSPSRNPFAGNSHGYLKADAPARDAVLEVFTRHAISCGERMVTVSLISETRTLSRNIPIEFVGEDDMDGAAIDEEAVERAEEWSRASSLPPEADRSVCVLPQFPEDRPNQYAYLEKEYRIDG
ncbi:hypothetical protein QWJ34_24835 [Saccharibacillus sp. CPCC 101409]|uniref:hypothetical protein n=1 Tax=Saccharibacillus sp. CPCC 101409 TaxID=3058041 RepID=UPI002673C5CD|nr:hypothetical protein [Saccharibacillus sp. CPCC 101409]MDO3413013.1 hypothetical protein [Saccharibacillus sp. CPCC 101409]